MQKTNEEIALKIAKERFLDIADFLNSIPEKHWKIIYDSLYSAALDALTIK